MFSSKLPDALSITFESQAEKKKNLQSVQTIHSLKKPNKHKRFDCLTNKVRNKERNE